MGLAARLWEVPEASDPDVLREVRLLYGVARPQIVVYVAAGGMLAIPGITGPAASRASVALLLASAALQVGALALARRGRIVAAGRAVVATTLGTAMLSVSLIGGLRGTLAATLTLAVLVAGIVRGWRSAGWSAVAAGLYAAAEHLAEDAGVAPFVQADVFPGAAVVSTIAMLGIVAALLAFYAREIEAAIEARRESDARALAHERALAEVVRNAPDGILVTDPQGRVESVNESLLRMTGLREDEIVGHLVTDLERTADPATMARIAEGFARSREGERVFLELELRRPDGAALFVETNGTLSERADGSVAAQIVVRDITARVVAERARKRLEQELLDARRMEGIGRLAGGVAHDFRNLLTPIIMNARTLAEGDVSQVPVLASEIEAAAQRANALTGQLLAFARRQMLEPQLLDVGVVVRGLEPILRRVVREDVAFELRLTPGLPPVRADRSQLEQIVVNLVANACDAMPRGGQLLVATAEVSAVPARGGPPAPHVALLVSDTGHGMSDEVRQRIFEPFYTTKEAGRGVGLGLATVHGVVTQSGGSVRVESEPGRGSTFRVLLPASSGAAPAPTPAPATLPAFAPGMRVLVADDAPLVRESVARVLRARGLEVLEASDGLAALAVAQSAAGPIELLVTDVVMPGLDGPGLAAELRRRQPRLAVLFISGYAGQGVVADGQVVPEVELLPKPFTPDQLLARVAEVLARSDPARVAG